MNNHTTCKWNSESLHIGIAAAMNIAPKVLMWTRRTIWKHRTHLSITKDMKDLNL